uniref:uL30 family ribosomal protein n=1 Tax=Methylobacterium sp. NMS12 TaxID=3079766 RepID=UPI003F882DA7
MHQGTVGSDRYIDETAIYVVQTGSPSRRPPYQLSCLKALSLGKIGRVHRHDDTPEIRGLLRAVNHLVLVLDYQPERLGVGQIVKQFRRRLGMSPRAFDAHRRREYDGRSTIRRQERRSKLTPQHNGVRSMIDALEEVTARLRAFREDPSMDENERLKLAAEPRRIHKTLFDADPDVARQAAFALVCTSKSFGSSYGPSPSESCRHRPSTGSDTTCSNSSRGLVIASTRTHR